MASAILQDQELINLLLPALRADLTALETYVYQEEDPLDCPIRAFGGRFDASTTETDLRGWQQHTSGSFELQLFPADHFFIRSNQSAVLTAIAKDIPINSFS
jgi:medium-chain acyl-[acyl-carrier-protein] hydrolase